MFNHSVSDGRNGYKIYFGKTTSAASLVIQMTMTEESQFKSWRRALAENKLTPEQLEVLRKMVEDGQAETVEAAAAMLDWQDTVIMPDEHMYGF